MITDACRRGRSWATACVLAVGLLTASAPGASAETAALPPITAETSKRALPGKFVWFDLLSEDVAAAKAFYGALFGWSFTASGDDYSLITLAGRPIGGLAAHESRADEVSESLWLPSLSVADVDHTVERLRSFGGSVLEGPLTVEGRGRMAVVSDHEGAPLVLLRSASGDPEDAPPPVGGWMWVDLVTQDQSLAMDFYIEVIGWDVTTVTDRTGNPFNLLQMDGRTRGGIVQVDWQGVEQNWLPYVRVTDPAATVRRAVELGGTPLLITDDLAILVDPTGAVVGIQSPSS
jgi:predicted enzyme related to lactoylglutathione lyase